MATNSVQDYYISPGEAIAKQKKLKERIKIKPLLKEVTTVAGADISFNRGSNVLHAGFVVLQLPDLKVIARSLSTKKVNFPYIPGLLAFREIPALLAAWKQLKRKPDVVIVDGHGLAHPRRMGIATQFGIEADQATMGCAKNILTGEHEKIDSTKGSYSYIQDDDEKIGIAYRSRTNINPVYISPGHNVSFKDTRSIVARCLTRYKLPETTRQAHQMVNQLRKGEVNQGYWENPELNLFE